MFFNKTSIKRGLMLAVITITICVPIFVFSADFGLGTTAKGAGYSDSQQDIYVMIANVMRVAFATLAFVFFGLTIYAGLRWLTARGDEKLIERGKAILEGAIWGLVIMSLAYGLATFIVDRLGPAPQEPSTQEPSKTTEEFCVCREECYEGETEDPFYERCSDPFIGCCGTGSAPQEQTEPLFFGEECCYFGFGDCTRIYTSQDRYHCIHETNGEGVWQGASLSCDKISNCNMWSP